MEQCMRMPLRLFSILLVSLLLSASPTVAVAPRAYIGQVELSRGGNGELLLSFQVQGTPDEQVQQTIESGLPVRFTYWVKVEKPRRFLPDSSLLNEAFERVLEKDNLKDRYLLTMEDGRPPRNVSSVADAIRVMTRVEGIRLLPLETLQKERPLYLKIKARLQRFELPFRLHYILPFVAYWDTDTEWYLLELPTSVDVLR